MQAKIIPFRRTEDKLVMLSQSKAESGDYLGALSFAFSALREKISTDNYALIAEIYSDMSLFELSNDYWFKYIDIANKENLSRAYEQLGINYFYLDNLWASGYYFHLKVKLDGFISQDNLDDDIIDFLSESIDKKALYKIVYPLDRVDYKKEIKRAKSTLVSGNYILASELYEKIPLSKLSEDDCGDASTAFFLAEKDDKSLEVSKYSLSQFGENVTAYCNLSTIYHLKKDEEKSRYYYSLALKVRKGEPEEYFKLATVAIEQSDHLIIKECVEYILSERPYDNNLRFFYGLALVNLGEFSLAKDNFSYTLRLKPDDYLIKYYYRLADKLEGKIIKGEKEYKYLKELPQKEIKRFKSAVKDIAENPTVIKSFIKKQENRDMLEYGLYSDDWNYVRNCIYVLGFSESPKSTDILLNALMKGEVSAEVKSNIIRAIILFDKADNFGVVGGSIYFRIKLKKLIFRGENDETEYFTAYAKAMSKVVFMGVENTDKLAFNINKIYKKLHKNPKISEFDSDELAGFTVLLSNYTGLSTLSAVPKIFSIKKERLNKLLSLFEGEKND